MVFCLNHLLHSFFSLEFMIQVCEVFNTQKSCNVKVMILYHSLKSHKEAMLSPAFFGLSLNCCSGNSLWKFVDILSNREIEGKFHIEAMPRD